MGRLPSPGIGWYRKKLDIPASDAGRRIFLDVDGAQSYSTVWINGTLVGGWPYGYASWRLDLTSYIVPGGVNQLAIRLDNPPESSRWYPGGGIYRNVWLVKTNPIHVGQWGSCITTSSVSDASATIDLKVTIDNDSPQAASIGVSTHLYAIDSSGKQTGDRVASWSTASTSIQPSSSSVVNRSITLPHPRLWGPPPEEQPNRYVAITTLFQHGKPIDRYETRFGIRSFQYDPDKGLLVNGQHIYIKGVNDHHDLGALGAAFNERAAERQLDMLHEMGCNAIRMSHNPPAPEVLELCDRMGFLVMDEIFDCWYVKKNPYDFHLIFPDWHEQDLRAMLRRDRNSPSVFLWSVGNEVGEQYTAEKGAAVARELVGIAHEEDPTRPVTASMNWAKADMPFPTAFDVLSLNYQGAGIRNIPTQYPAFHIKVPTKMILSSESAAALSTRGEYLFPVTTQISSPVRNGTGGDAQRHVVSDYALYAADFGSSADRVFASQQQHPFAAGEFVWSGWDYLGEPTPYYTARSSYFGIIDLAGFKKDQFYLYQSQWRPDLPMAHILPHWTWPDRVGQVTPVHVFTSGNEAELFLNGKSLGRKKKGPLEYRLRWDDVVYEPGELKVIAYKAGKPWATDLVRTAGAPATLDVAADRSDIRSDGRDLSFITVRVVDQSGSLAPRADNLIRFTIDGPGEIVATDNGDPTNLESFKSTQREAFNGLCLAIIRAKPGVAGSITLHASADALSEARITLVSVAAH
jgi:beta-galactosidase